MIITNSVITIFCGLQVQIAIQCLAYSHAVPTWCPLQFPYAMATCALVDLCYVIVEVSWEVSDFSLLQISSSFFLFSCSLCRMMCRLSSSCWSLLRSSTVDLPSQLSGSYGLQLLPQLVLLSHHSCSAMLGATSLTRTKPSMKSSARYPSSSRCCHECVKSSSAFVYKFSACNQAVLAEISHDIEFIAHERHNASLLICDIVDFCTLVCRFPSGSVNFSFCWFIIAFLVVFMSPQTSRLRPEDVIAILNVVFSTFDVLSTMHAVYKVETIGLCSPPFLACRILTFCVCVFSRRCACCCSARTLFVCVCSSSCCRLFSFVSSSSAACTLPMRLSVFVAGFGSFPVNRFRISLLHGRDFNRAESHKESRRLRTRLPRRDFLLPHASPCAFAFVC